jgi:hypothetical protein
VEGSCKTEIVIEPWKRLVIHEVIEYSFDDFMKLLISQSRAVAGGTPATNWANGIIFHFGGFPDTDSVMQEKLHGVIHWSSVMFAVKETYEPQYRQDSNYVNLINASHNQVFVELANVLKQRTKFGRAASA